MGGRFRWTLALALATSGSALGQTTGTVIGVVTDASTGKPVEGAAVVAVSPSKQGEATATSDARGQFRLDLLPPGTYAVAASADGYLREERGGARVGLDRTLRVNLVLVPSTVALPEQVVRGGQAPAVDVGSAEAGGTYPAAFVEAIPFRGREWDAVAAAAPGAVSDVGGVGFRGAQSPENRYLVNGFDVTHPYVGIAGIDIPPEFLEQVEVKSGHMQAEHGRATGGLLAAVTRSGSNELHGRVFSGVRLSPADEWVGENGRAVWTRSGAAGSFKLDTGAEVGGPILRDRLWFHLGLAPRLERNIQERALRANVLPDAAGECPASSPTSEVPLLGGATALACKDRASGTILQVPIGGTTERRGDDTRGLGYHGKLTARLTSDQNLTLTALGVYDEAELGSRGPGDGLEAAYRTPRRFTSPTESLTARWAGRFRDGRLAAEAQAGWYRSDTSPHFPGAVDGLNLRATPAIAWQPGVGMPLGLFEAVPAACQEDAACPVGRYVTGGWGGQAGRGVQNDRLSGRLALTALADGLGPHAVKLGLDAERTASSQRAMLPNQSWRYSPNTNGALRFLLIGWPGAVRSESGRTVAADGVDFPGRLETSALSTSAALFLQDSWRPIPDVTLNAGLRWEAQAMSRRQNRLPESRIQILDSLAPRLQAVWDPTGRGRGKLAGAWGRYFEGIPLLLGVNGLGRGTATVNGRAVPGSCPGFTLPGPAPFQPLDCGDLLFSQNGAATNPVAPGLRGQFVDQFGLAAEVEPVADLVVGISYEGRRLGRIIEDMSSDGGTFFVGNPGDSRPFVSGGVAFDPRQATLTDPTTSRTIQATIPRPERSYDGVSFRVAKSFSRRWLAEASYTWSVLRGNYAGPIIAEAGAVSPNWTPDYDLPGLSVNNRGLLPGDHTHTLKLFGAYRFEVTPRLAPMVGAALVARSGAPVSALGADPGLDPYTGYLVARGGAGRTPWVTQLDLRAGLEWAFRAPYSLRASLDLYNVTGASVATAVDQLLTTDSAMAIAGLRCRGNPAGARDPLAALIATCPDLAFLKTPGGRPATFNQNWGRPIANVAPRAARIALAVAF